jgi:UDP-N-acetylmuramoyl-tripeptide--D-alanyl-D-alanine ligase
VLGTGGKLFVNGDDEWCLKIAAASKAGVIRVGFGSENDWIARINRLDRNGTLFHAENSNAGFRREYRIGLIGRHQVVNALLAIAVAAEFGLSPLEVAAGLQKCEPPKMRLQLWEAQGVRVLDDAYNANADSMLAALRTLQEFPCKGRRVAVLGDMAELGKHTQAAHEEVGRRAAELGIGQLFAIGSMAPVMARAAREAGLSRVLEFADVESAAAAVKSFVRNGDLLLVKASRSARLERISEVLKRN